LGRAVKHVDEPLDAVAVSDASALFGTFLHELRRLFDDRHTNLRLFDNHDLVERGIKYSKRHL
jgi:hypothetical protein